MLPALSIAYQESSVMVTTQDQASTALRMKMREEHLKEMEAVWESKLAERTLDVENVWRRKRDERTKIVEDYWKKKLVEAQSNGNDGKTSELYEEIEVLKKKLEKGPGLIKAAEERGKRQGELDGFNKISLNPELKPSQDRLNFDFLMKDKEKQLADVKTARNNWFIDARRYSEDMNAKLRGKDQEIQRLQAQIETQLPQQPIASESTDALIAEGRRLQVQFDNQTQELVNLRQQCNQQAAGLDSLTAQFKQKSEELSSSQRQLDIKSAELDLNSEQLDKMTREVSSLRRESDQKCVELNDSNEELRKKSSEIKSLREGREQDSEELSDYSRQPEAQSEEIAALRTRLENAESSNQEKDRKIVSLRDLLDSSSRHQFTNSDQEEVKRLKRELATSDSRLAAAEAENASLRENQARIELENLPTESRQETAEADVELVRVMLATERTKNEEENFRRDVRATIALGRLEESEQRRRQMLMEGLEGRDAELYDAREAMKELNEKLLAGNQATAAALAAAASSSHISAPSASASSSSSTTTSSTTSSRSWYQLPRLPTTNLSSRRMLILAIFLLAFFIPHIQSVAQRAAGDSWQAANQDSRYEVGGLASREERMRWEAWTLENRERNEGVPSYEEAWRRTQEVGRSGDWGNF